MHAGNSTTLKTRCSLPGYLSLHPQCEKAARAAVPANTTAKRDEQNNECKSRPSEILLETFRESHQAAVFGLAGADLLSPVEETGFAEGIALETLLDRVVESFYLVTHELFGHFDGFAKLF